MNEVYRTPPNTRVIPANAGTQVQRFGNPQCWDGTERQRNWVPAFAGMTSFVVVGTHK